jgi:glyoxylase-like metal-dependent hydrolase (beta-lactamase superfamily II)
MPIPLEDNFADIVRKAQRGLGLSDRGLASRAGIAEETLTSTKEEHYNAEALRKLAPVLGLAPQALATLPDYQPAPITLPRLAAFSTVWGGMRVNAYLAWDAPGGHAAVFDTGTDCTAILETLRAKSLTLCGIFITHTHGDHIEALDRLRNETGARVFVSSREPLPGADVFEAGREFECGRLRIATRLTWGHSRGGTTYVVHGLERPVAVVGDALFAGSMGGGLVSYADALRTNRQEILTLPPETVICPGHGPLTTVAEEGIHNPFFA